VGAVAGTDLTVAAPADIALVVEAKNAETAKVATLLPRERVKGQNRALAVGLSRMSAVTGRTETANGPRRGTRGRDLVHVPEIDRHLALPPIFVTLESFL